MQKLTHYRTDVSFGLAKDTVKVLKGFSFINVRIAHLSSSFQCRHTYIVCLSATIHSTQGKESQVVVIMITMITSTKIINKTSIYYARCTLLKLQMEG